MTESARTSPAYHLTVDTPNGSFTVIHDDEAVLASGWTDDPDYLKALINPRLRPTTVIEPGDPDDEFGQRIAAAVAAYYDGDATAVDDIAVVQAGGPFIEQAWKVLRGVPAGESRTYTQFAEMAGNGSAVRAAAMACASNAAALFVPCHRVQRSDGSLGGFRYGLEIKRWLLNHEAPQPAG